MKNFIFKSSRGLIKNDSIHLGVLDRRLELIQAELRHQRSDLRDLSRKIDRLLIDKHLQFQVDEYFENDDEPSPQTEHETKVHVVRPDDE